MLSAATDIVQYAQLAVCPPRKLVLPQPGSSCVRPLTCHRGRYHLGARNPQPVLSRSCVARATRPAASLSSPPASEYTVQDLIRMGELCQVTYDNFQASDGTSRYSEEEMLLKCLPHGNHGGQYTQVSFVYASSGYAVDEHKSEDTKRIHWNWQGYVALSPDQQEIVVAWRGTIRTTEWLQNVKAEMTNWEISNGHNLRVHDGFFEMYMNSPGDKPAPQEQVRSAISKILASEAGDNVQRVVTTGHSLGGALATISALDLAVAGLATPSGHKPEVQSYTYASPLVGDDDFKKAFDELVPVCYRVVNKWDVVPRVPLFSLHDLGEYLGQFLIKKFKKDDPVENKQKKEGILNSILNTFTTVDDHLLEAAGALLGDLDHASLDEYELPKKEEEPQEAYKHVGTLVSFNSVTKKYIKNQWIGKFDDFIHYVGVRHNLEVYLHIISNGTRDCALMNKGEDAIDPKKLTAEFKDIPICWWDPEGNPPNKGMVFNEKTEKWRPSGKAVQKKMVEDVVVAK